MTAQTVAASPARQEAPGITRLAVSLRPWSDPGHTPLIKRAVQPNADCHLRAASHASAAIACGYHEKWRRSAVCDEWAPDRATGLLKPSTVDRKKIPQIPSAVGWMVLAFSQR